MTDPAIVAAYEDHDDGWYEIDNAILCVSLAEVFRRQQAAYKLVASIVTPDTGS